MARKSDGTVYVDTLIDTKGFGKGVHTMQKQIGGLSGALSKLGGVIAATFAVGKLIQFGKEAVNLGSDLQEVQNVVDVTFSTMSKQVDEFAKSAAQLFGLSETMAKKFTGTFGAMAKSFGFIEEEAFEMSTTLAGLSGDVASFYNLTQEEAYTKLKSVFTGETESLKDLGVVMTQTALDSYAMANGFGMTTKSMTEQQKVALRYRFVLDQLNGASGDFVRTSDSWANQVRLLTLQFDSFKATIGQGLINILTPVVKMLNVFLAKLQQVANAFKSLTEQLFGKQESNGATDNLEDIQDGYEGIADATEDAEKAQEKYLTGLDEIRTYQTPEEMVSTDVGFDISDKQATQETNDNLEQTDGILAKLEERFPRLIQFLEDIKQKVKEIIQDIKLGDFKELGKDISELVVIIFDFISEVIDEIDWKSIGKKIGEFLAGIDWLSVIKSGFKLKFNIWKAIAEVWLGAFEAAPLETAIITAISALKFTPLGGILSGAIKKALTGGALASGITSAFTSLGGIGGILTTDLAAILGAGTLTEIGLTAGVAIVGGLVAAIGGFNLGKELGKLINPEDESLYDEFKWFGEGGFFDVAFDDLATSFDAIVEMATDFTNNPIIAGLTNVIAGPIGAAVLQIEGHKEEIKGFFDSVIKDAETMGLNLGKWVSTELIPWFTKTVSDFKEKFKKFKEDIQKGISDFCNKSKEFFSKFKEGVVSIWEKIPLSIKKSVNNIISVINSMISGVCNGINQMINALNALKFDVPDWVPLIGGESFSLNIGTVSVPQIPYLATGAVIPPNAPFMAVLGDQRHGTNIEAPLDTIKQAVREVVGSGSGGQYQFTAQINRRTLFDEMIDEAKLRQSTSGNNPFDLA